LDDKKARNISDYYGIEWRTTLGIILEFLKDKLISKLDFNLNVTQYTRQGWISQEEINEILEEGQKIE